MDAESNAKVLIPKGLFTIPTERELMERVSWFINLRWYAAVGVILGTLFAHHALKIELPRAHLILIGFSIIIYNLLFRLYFRRICRRSESQLRTFRRFTKLQINMDWLALIAIAHYTGGVQSPVLPYFIFHIVIDAIFLSGRECYLQITFAMLLIACAVFFEYANLITPVRLGFMSNSGYSSNLLYPGCFLFFFISALYITGFLTISIASALREKERKLVQQQKELKNLQDKLIQSEKLASVGRLAAGVAHEINNPLTGILTFSHFLSKRAEQKDFVKEYSEKIVGETMRCRKITRGLLDFARQTEPEKEPADINNIAKDTLALVENQAKIKNIKIVEELNEPLPTITVDVNQIQEVFMNIVLNALDSMSDGGLLTVHSSMNVDGGFIETEFIDTGCGIPKENLDKLFDPFFTTKKVGEGTGLGLAVSYGIIEKHNGMIEVESEEGKGSTFMVKLPV